MYCKEIKEIIADQHRAILARRASARAEIEELVRQTQEIALHLEGLQQEARGSFTQSVGEALGMKPAAAAEEARRLRTMAKRPVDKTFFVVNGMLPAPPRKTPKAAKPSSPIMKAASLQETILSALERGLNDQEAEILRAMIDKLRKELG